MVVYKNELLKDFYRLIILFKHQKADTFLHIH